MPSLLTPLAQDERRTCALRATVVAVGMVVSACGQATAASNGTQKDDPDPIFSAGDTAALHSLSPATLPAAPKDSTNQWSDDARAAAWGKTLFSDTAFAGRLLDADNDGSPGALGKVGDTGKVACAGCHLPSAGFSDTRSFQRQISLGAGWGRRRAPSLLDVAQARLLMWDGRRDALYNQPFGPIESVVEMNSSRLFVAEYLFRRYKADYEALFGAMPTLDDSTQFPALSAGLTGCQPKNPTSPPPTCDGTFHGIPGDHAEFDSMSPANQEAVTRVVVNAGKAIGAYERTLTCGPSHFDAWMHGDGTALSRAAQRGAQLFVGKGRCASCHSGPFLSDQQFHNVGLRPGVVQQNFTDSDDGGALVGIAAALADPLNSQGKFSDGHDSRLHITVTPQMSGAFRTPILRCVGLRPTFMHSGQLGSLAKVVAFFSDGGDKTGYPGTNELAALNLSAREQSDLTEFLGELTGPAAASTSTTGDPGLFPVSHGVARERSGHGSSTDDTNLIQRMRERR
ncbi:MAG: cytochrome c peroxidase [Polyangiaceae bacterium]